MKGARVYGPDELLWKTDEHSGAKNYFSESTTLCDLWFARDYHSGTVCNCV